MREDFKTEVVDKKTMEQILDSGRVRGFIGFDYTDVEFCCSVSGGYRRADFHNPPEYPQIDDLAAFFPLGSNWLILPLDEMDAVPEMRKLRDRIEEKVLADE